LFHIFVVPNFCNSKKQSQQQSSKIVFFSFTFLWPTASLTAQRNVSLHSLQQSCIQHSLQISPSETFRFISNLSKINVI
jgi:hypothetical protein